VTLFLIAVVPSVVSSIPALARSESLTLMTRERVVTNQVAASAADVAAGLATAEGQTIAKTRRIEPVSVFFEEGVVRVDPKDVNSPKTGKGLFRTEAYLLHVLGFDVAGFTSAHLLTTRYMVDFLIPVILVIVVSLLSRPTDPVRVARFYARMKTPVAPTLEEDAVVVEASYANPTRYDHQKLFPNSNWEFTKWDKVDALGFLACCALVGVVLVVFKGVLVVGS
jgi:solute:Na+ symporter, SSS family